MSARTEVKFIAKGEVVTAQLVPWVDHDGRSYVHMNTRFKNDHLVGMVTAPDGVLFDGWTVVTSSPWRGNELQGRTYKTLDNALRALAKVWA